VKVRTVYPPETFVFFAHSDIAKADGALEMVIAERVETDRTIARSKDLARCTVCLRAAFFECSSNLLSTFRR
jgi:hypothetical protein